MDDLFPAVSNMVASSDDGLYIAYATSTLNQTPNAEFKTSGFLGRYDRNGSAAIAAFPMSRSDSWSLLPSLATMRPPADKDDFSMSPKKAALLQIAEAMCAGDIDHVPDWFTG